METREPRQGKIYESMAKIMSEIGKRGIGKDQKNQQQGFMFRGIDQVYNTLNDIMAEQGVISLPTVLDDRTEERQTKSGTNLIYRIYKMRYDFYAIDGSSVSAIVIGEGMDSGDKAGNKAMAIAHKYCLLQSFCIPTEELKDPDYETHEVIGKGQKTIQEKPVSKPVAKAFLNEAKNAIEKPGDNTMQKGDLNKAISAIRCMIKPEEIGKINELLGKRYWTPEEWKTLTEEKALKLEALSLQNKLIFNGEENK